VAGRNRQVFESALEAFNRRDIEELLTYLDTEIEWYPVLEVLLGGAGTVYRGHDGVREFFAAIDEAMAEIRAEMVTIAEESENQIVASGRLHARGRLSGAVTDAPLGWLTRFRGEKVVLVRSFRSVGDALQAARE